MTTTTTTTNEVSKVWLGCIGCYNEGNLVGKWMPADQLEDTHDKGQKLIRAVGCNKPLHGEWRIHDYDGPIASCYSEEHPDIDELIEMMNFIDEDSLEFHPDTYTVALMVHRDRTTDAPTVSELEELAHEVIHIGYRHDLKDYFMEWAYDVGYITSGHPMESYIDWEHFAQNCMYDYSEYECNGNLYIVENY